MKLVFLSSHVDINNDNLKNAKNLQNLTVKSQLPRMS